MFIEKWFLVYGNYFLQIFLALLILHFESFNSYHWSENKSVSLAWTFSVVTCFGLFYCVGYPLFPFSSVSSLDKFRYLAKNRLECGFIVFLLIYLLTHFLTTPLSEFIYIISPIFLYSNYLFTQFACWQLVKKIHCSDEGHEVRKAHL